MKNITTIIFDLDGVVIDSENIADKANTLFFAQKGLVYDREQIKPLLSGKTLKEATAFLKQEYRLEGDVESLLAEKLRIRQELYEREISYIPGAEQFITEVDAYNVKKAIATASPLELLKIANDKLHLSKKFDPHIYAISGVQCRSKPAPDIFLYAAQKLNVPSEKCLVIEDAPLGIQAALAAGMRVIGLTTTYRREQLTDATAIVDSYEEIAHILFNEKK